MTEVGAAQEADPSVCYRHPDRQSWILCQRCGRTICPECQILAPVGVQCPECVREAGGSVQWKSTTPHRATTAAKTRNSPRWVQALRRMVRPDSGSPVLSWGIAGTSVLLWLIGLVTSVPFIWLASLPGQPAWQIWRFLTSSLVNFPGFDFRVLISVALNILFFLLIAPTVERSMPKTQFLTIFFAGGIIGSAGMMLAGLPSYGLGGALFGLFGAYVVLARASGAPLTQFLIVIGLNVVINLLFGGYSLPQIIGGLVGGAGAAFLFYWHENRARSKPVTPYWQIGLACAAFIVIALVRSSLG